jgi:hypothetical protein
MKQEKGGRKASYCVWRWCHSSPRYDVDIIPQPELLDLTLQEKFLLHTFDYTPGQQHVQCFPNI